MKAAKNPHNSSLILYLPSIICLAIPVAKKILLMSEKYLAKSSSRLPILKLVHRYGDFFMGLNLALNGLIHSFGFAAWNPDFITLIADLNNDAFEEVEMSFYKAIKSNFLSLKFTSANGT